MRITVHQNDYMVRDEDGRIGLSEHVKKLMTQDEQDHVMSCIDEVFTCLNKHYVRIQWEGENVK